MTSHREGGGDIKTCCCPRWVFCIYYYIIPIHIPIPIHTTYIRTYTNSPNTYLLR